MNQTDFEDEVFSGTRSDYVSTEALEYFRNMADYRVIDKSAMDDADQDKLVSVSLPKSGDNFSDAELISKVQDKLGSGNQDIQKYQLRDGNDTPTVVEIWRHGNGYSAYALAE